MVRNTTLHIALLPDDHNIIVYHGHLGLFFQGLQCGGGDEPVPLSQKAFQLVFGFFTVFQWAPALTKDIIKSDVL